MHEPQDPDDPLAPARGQSLDGLLALLEQLDGAEDVMDALVLRFEEQDGITKLVRCTTTGFDIELHHILTYT